MQCGRQKLSNCWWLRPCTREVLCDSGRFLYGSHPTRPDQPGQARPDQAKPHQTKHGKVRHQSAFRYARTHTHSQAVRMPAVSIKLLLRFPSSARCLGGVQEFLQRPQALTWTSSLESVGELCKSLLPLKLPTTWTGKARNMKQHKCFMF